MNELELERLVLSDVANTGLLTAFLHAIESRSSVWNEPSWKLMERLGMRREAHFRESHLVNGEWRDEYIYAVLANEWTGDL